MSENELTKTMDEIISFFKEKKGHTLSSCTHIGVETHAPIIPWVESREIRFTLWTGNDMRYWKGFDKKIKEKFPCVDCCYLSKTDGSCSSCYVVRIKK